jgi:hypothetical protein
VLAARFLGEVGDIGRFPSKHHFAAHTGTRSWSRCAAGSTRLLASRLAMRTRVMVPPWQRAVRQPHPYSSCCRVPVVGRPQVKRPGVTVADRGNRGCRVANGPEMVLL